MKFHKQREQRLLQVFIAGIAILLFICILIAIIPRQSGPDVIKAFYKHEQKQEFWNSYELFHPYMKERFRRDQYIDQRSHIFVNHFGVESYSVEFGKSTKLTDWKMSDDYQPLEEVYKVPVTKTYESTFGKFSIMQDVYAAKEDGEWYVLWDYKY